MVLVCVIPTTQVDYLDLVYVHWPVLTCPDDPTGLKDASVAPDAAAHVHAYKALEQLVKEGKVVSNVRVCERYCCLANILHARRFGRWV